MSLRKSFIQLNGLQGCSLPAKASFLGCEINPPTRTRRGIAGPRREHQARKWGHVRWPLHPKRPWLSLVPRKARVCPVIAAFQITIGLSRLAHHVPICKSVPVASASLESRSQSPAELRLKSHHVAQIPLLYTFPPQMRILVCGRLHWNRADTQARSPNRCTVPSTMASTPSSRTNLRYRLPRSFVLHGRSSRNHPQRADFCKISDQCFGKSVGEIFLLRVARQVFQGEYYKRLNLSARLF